MARTFVYILYSVVMGVVGGVTGEPSWVAGSLILNCLAVQSCLRDTRRKS